MQEIHGLKNEINELKKVLSLQKTTQRKSLTTQKKMEKLDADTQKIYKYKIDPKCVQDNLTELQDRSCRDNERIDGRKETKEER